MKITRELIKVYCHKIQNSWAEGQQNSLTVIKILLIGKSGGQWVSNPESDVLALTSASTNYQTIN